MFLWLPVQVAMVGTNLHNQRKSDSTISVLHFLACVIVSVCVSERECVCVCMRESERERETAHVTTAKRALVLLATEFKETP